MFKSLYYHIAKPFRGTLGDRNDSIRFSNCWILQAFQLSCSFTPLTEATNNFFVVNLPFMEPSFKVSLQKSLRLCISNAKPWLLKHKNRLTIEVGGNSSRLFELEVKQA